MEVLIVSLFSPISYMKKDKWILIFSLIPIFLGLVLFWLIGDLFFNNFKNWGLDYLKTNVRYMDGFPFLEGILVTLLGIVFFFILNFTFVLIVSVFASPFNDMISSRVEAAILGKKKSEISETLRQGLKRFFKTVFTEIKKVSLIILISVLGLFAGPFSVLISAILMAVSFIDYSWSRHEFSLKDCINNYKKGFFPYSLAGFVYLFLMAIPVVNVFMLPMAVISFTISFTKLSEFSRGDSGASGNPST